jgi:hypothetical protein
MRAMSVFTEAEIDYMGRVTLARPATIGPDGRPHVIPLTYRYHADEDAIDIGGIDFAAAKKWRDARQNPKVGAGSTPGSRTSSRSSSGCGRGTSSAGA